MHFFDRMTLNPEQRLMASIAVGEAGVRNPMIGYGGAGGGGKSYGLRAATVYGLLAATAMGFPMQSTIIATADFPRLRDRHYAKYVEEYAWLGATLTDTKLYGPHIRFERAPHIGVVKLRNLKNPDGYRGSEACLVAIDEPTELPEKIKGENVLALLLYPLRTPADFPFSTLCMGMNPDGIGHGWTKRLFITGESVKHNDRPRIFFIKATYEDNEHITQEWYNNLQYFSESVRKARLEGSWDSPSGVRWPQLSREAHLFRFSERFPRGIPERYPIRIGYDYGLRNPFGAVWIATDEDRDIWVFREAYGSGLLAVEQARVIAEKTGLHEYGIGIHADPAIWNQTNREGRERASLPHRVVDDLERQIHGDPRFNALIPARNNRAASFSLLDRLISRDNGHPNLYIEEGCENLWRELTEAQWDQRGGLHEWAEDIDPRNPDHGIDALRYGVDDILQPAPRSDRVIDLAGAIAAREARISKEEAKIYDRILRA